MKRKHLGLTKELRDNIEQSAIQDFSKVFPTIVVDIKTKKGVDKFVGAYIKNKTDQFYEKGKGLVAIDNFIDPKVLIKSHSKAEMIFRSLLMKADIPFEYQYKIGPYWADFLIKKWLIVEVDGPQHMGTKEYDKKRDKYMEKMGYSVLRIPIWLLTINQDAVIDKIKEKLK